MNGVIDTRDRLALGVNPCGEQPLEDRECCTLAELYLPKIPDRATWRRVIKHAYRYAKLITIASEHMQGRSREVMLRNRRIGLSVTGVTQFLATHGMDELISWLNDGYAHVDRYDGLYSQWYGVPRSIRMTTVKPSGNTSVTFGVTPGAHYSVAGRYHIRRVNNIPLDSPLVAHLADCGYPVEQSAYTPGTACISFPVDMGADVPGEDEVSLEDQLELACTLQRYWSGNAVSLTGKFDPAVYSPADLANVIGSVDRRLKTLSVLPLGNDTYAQMPYERLDATQYEALITNLRPAKVAEVAASAQVADLYCDSDRCEVTP